MVDLFLTIFLSENKNLKPFLMSAKSRKKKLLKRRTGLFISYTLKKLKELNVTHKTQDRKDLTSFLFDCSWVPAYRPFCILMQLFIHGAIKMAISAEPLAAD